MIQQDAPRATLISHRIKSVTHQSYRIIGFNPTCLLLSINLFAVDPTHLCESEVLLETRLISPETNGVFSANMTHICVHTRHLKFLRFKLCCMANESTLAAISSFSLLLLLQSFCRRFPLVIHSVTAKQPKVTML